MIYLINIQLVPIITISSSDSMEHLYNKLFPTINNHNNMQNTINFIYFIIVIIIVTIIYFDIGMCSITDTCY